MDVVLGAERDRTLKLDVQERLKPGDEVKTRTDVSAVEPDLRGSAISRGHERGQLRLCVIKLPTDAECCPCPAIIKKLLDPGNHIAHSLIAAPLQTRLQPAA